MKFSDVIQEVESLKWDHSFPTEIQSHSMGALENGKILLFPKLEFVLLPHEKKFLSQDYAGKKTKNISFNSATGLMRGTSCSAEEYQELKRMLQRFAEQATQLIHNVLPFYTPALQRGRTSFRPVEIAGRVSSYRKDDTRLHVDAFPATPNQGRRILRVFTNINPDGQDRVWRIGEPFSEVAKRFLPLVGKAWPGKSILLEWLKLTKTYRSPYDHMMLQIHDKMKADVAYQQTVPQCEICFAPGSSWVVQTDHVSHAAMAGQHVLEQTFYLPVHAMHNPDLSPLHTLEKLSGRLLVAR